MNQASDLRYNPDISSFVEYYRQSDLVLRRYFVQAVGIAASGQMEGRRLAEFMMNRIKHNEYGIEKAIDPTKLNGFFFRCASLDTLVANFLMGELFDKATGVTQTETGGIKLKTHEEVLTAPAVECIVEGMIPESGLVFVYGPSGTYKTFFVLDIAHCIAAGIEWHGRKIKQGSVVYIAGEGGAGLSKRYKAWMEHHNISGPIPLYTHEGPLNISDPTTVEELIRVMPQDTRLVIIDTLHANLEGNEDKAADTKPFIDGCRKIQLATKATTLVIHHANSQGEMRGSKSLQAASETTIKVEPAGERMVEISCVKQKDFAKFEPFFMEHRTVPLPEPYGASKVMIMADPIAVQQVAKKPATKKTAPSAVRSIVRVMSPHEGLTPGEIQELAGVSDKTWRKYRDILLECGRIEKDGNKYRLVSALDKDNLLMHIDWDKYR